MRRLFLTNGHGWLPPGLVVIPCGAAKSATPAPAAELYVGQHFRLALQAARAIVTGDDSRVRILSARHGLLELHELVEPYTQTAASWQGREHHWAALIRAQAGRQGLLEPGEAIVALTPLAYTRALVRVWDGWVAEAMRATRGIGDQRHVLAELRGAAR